MRIILLTLIASLSVYCIHAQKNLQEETSIDLILAGVESISEEDFNEAERLFKLVSVNDTNYVLAQKELALVYTATERNDQAVDVLQHLLTYESAFEDRATVYTLLAQAYSGMEKYDEAIEVLDQGLIEYPMNSKMHYYKGLTYESKDQYQDALETYKEGVLANINAHDLHLRLGILAAEEGNYTEALLSLATCLMIEPAGDDANKIVIFMEEIADGSHTPEPKGLKLSEKGDDFNDLNLLIKNKVALQSKYKAKFTVSTAYARQLHLILSTAKYDEDDEGFWHQVYLPFYEGVMQQDLLDPMVLLTLVTVDNEKTQKKVNSKKAVIEKFLKQGKDIWSSASTDQLMEFEGKKQHVTVIYQNSGVIMGLSKDDKLFGNWYYYYREGNLQLRAQFNDAGKKHGTFKRYDVFTQKLIEEIAYENGEQNGSQKNYHSSGELKQILTFKNNEVVDTVFNYYRGGQIEDKIPVVDNARQGVSSSYYPNGTLQAETNYEAGVANGFHRLCHPNGKMDIDMNIENDLASGSKKAYYPDGQLRYEYTMKEDFIEGDFKRYYSNGKLEETGSMIKGKYFGENINYYSDGTVYSKGTYDESGKENGILEYFDSQGRKFQALEFKKGDLRRIELFDTDGNSIKEIKRNGKKLAYENYYPTRTLYCEGVMDGEMRSGTWKYYDNYGTITKTEKYVDGKLQDSVIAYHPNGKVRYIIEYNSDKREGLYLEYNPFGVLIQEGRYANDEPVNDWYEYYEDGTIKEEYAFKNGIQHGFQNYYAPNGKLHSYDIFSDGNIISSIYLDTNEAELQRFGQFDGEVRLLDPLGNYDRFVGNYNSGSINGLTKWYDLEGNLETEGMNINGKREGDWIWYYKDGTKQKVIPYKDGEIHGEYRSYHENGKVQRVSNFAYGQLQGKTAYFFNNGKKETESEYMDDERHGNMITYGYDGSTQQIRHYDRGVLLSYTYLDKNGKEVPPVKVEKGETTFKVYYQSGKLAVEQTRINGLLHNVYKEYYPNGTLMTEGNYYYGDLQGTYKRFHPNGKLKSEISYKNDEAMGQEKTYHDNGNLKEITTYVNGERHGPREIYSKEGKLIKTYTYYNGYMVEAK